jgi:hypothetical protein
MIRLNRPSGAWNLLQPFEKLVLRGQLPGAFGYDRAAHSLRVMRAKGASLRELLPLALPTSWMVNNTASSPVFRKWLADEALAAWESLARALEDGYAGWLEASPATRAEVTAAARSLAIDGHGSAALSKVMALLAPHAVPLMDDAALAFALAVVPVPKTADKPVAGPEHFVAMLDWFAHAVSENERDLIEIAREYDLAVLDAPQVLDRLLWMETWGWKITLAGRGESPRWWWLRDGSSEGIVVVPGPHPEVSPEAPIDLTTHPDTPWRAVARATLAEAIASEHDEGH